MNDRGGAHGAYVLTMPISPTQAGEFAASWYAAWNSHNIDAIMAHYALGIEHSSPFIKRYNGTDDTSLRGADVVREYFAMALARNPTLRFDPRHIAVGLESVALTYTRMNGDFAAEIFFLDAAGKITRSVSHYCLVANKP